MAKLNHEMSSDEIPGDVDPDLKSDPSTLNDTLWFESRHDKRQTSYHASRDTPFWSASQVSLPKGKIWGSPGSASFDPRKTNGETFTYNYDTANAQDTYVYMINEHGIYNSHEVSSHTPVQPFPSVR